MNLREKEWQNQLIQLEERQKNLISNNNYEHSAFFAENEAEVTYLIETYAAFGEREIQLKNLKQEIKFQQVDTKQPLRIWSSELETNNDSLKRKRTVPQRATT